MTGRHRLWGPSALVLLAWVAAGAAGWWRTKQVWGLMTRTGFAEAGE